MRAYNSYSNDADNNIERLLREKKWARVVIGFAALGLLAGITAALTFFVHYQLILISTLALLSGKNPTKTKQKEKN